MTARDGGTRAAGHANGRVARGYTPRLKTSFPPRVGGARIERSCSAGRRSARLGLAAVEGGSGRRGPRDRTVPAEPWRSVERRLQQQLWSILPVRSAWRKGCPLSERKRAAQKVGAVSILWRRRDPEAGRGCFERRGASVAGSTVPYQLWTVLFEWKSPPRAYEPTGLVGVRAIAVGRQVWAVLLCTLSS